MTQRYFTYDEIIALCDDAVMRAKQELAQEIALDKKYTQSHPTCVR